MELGKYSFGIGDRFGCQGKAQLEAIRKASKQGIESSFTITQEELEKIAGKFLFAIQEARKIYDYIIEKKGEGNFISERMLRLNGLTTLS